MKQGDYGWFQNQKTGERAWLLKARDASNVCCYINKNNGDIIASEIVGTMIGETSGIDWVLLYELDQVEANRKYVTFTPPDDIAELIREDDLHWVAGRIDMLEKKERELYEAFSEQVEKTRVCRDRWEEVKEALASARNDMQAITNGNDLMFCYVYGKHHATDDKDWCWYAAPDIAAYISAGDTVLADTKYGAAPVIVTRVERATDYRPHKRIIEIMTHHKENSNG